MFFSYSSTRTFCLDDGIDASIAEHDINLPNSVERHLRGFDDLR
jgi:hypothetical protein